VEHTKVLILGQGTRVEKAVELITSKVKSDENKVLFFFFFINASIMGSIV
jgi:hypothetical protein